VNSAVVTQDSGMPTQIAATDLQAQPTPITWKNRAMSESIRSSIMRGEASPDGMSLASATFLQRPSYRGVQVQLIAIRCGDYGNRWWRVHSSLGDAHSGGWPPMTL
jgi:hypothetical protein